MSKTIEICRRADSLIVEYEPRDGSTWAIERLRNDGSLRIKRTFYFQRADLLSPDLLERTGEHEEFEALVFELGTLANEYFVIPGAKLSISQNVLIHQSFEPEVKHFIAPRQVSVFRQIADLSQSDIYIGGPKRDAIPVSEFERVVARMPTDYELKKYVAARVSAVVRNYLDDAKDAEHTYKRYRDRQSVGSPMPARLSDQFRDYEIDRFSAINDRLVTMLHNEEQYSEKQWQAEVVDILLLINPKYIKTFREAPIFDSHTSKERRVDFLLMDADGNVDALELKKPFDNAVITEATYRGNYVPLRELSGSIIQVEKYLYHLVRSGEKGVARLNKKYGEMLPQGIKIKVTNPSGLVLIGRDNNLTPEQRLDLEVIRKHYKNMVDIITYDDLLRRLQSILSLLRQEHDGNTGAGA